MATKEVEHVGTTQDEHAQIFLQPIAGASILGLAAFAAASFVIGAQFAGWRGFGTNVYTGPFLAAFFGFAEFAAAMWAYRAREGVSTAFHGMWGMFWVAFGVLNLSYAAGWIAPPLAGLGGPIGYWFIALALVSASCAAAALSTNFALFAAKLVISAGAIALAVGMLGGSAIALATGGYLFMISALLAWYTSSAMMLEDTFGRVILPLGEFRSREAEMVSTGAGEPGVLHGEWHAHKPRHASHA